MIINKLVKILVFIFIILVNVCVKGANLIDKIEMNVYIDNNGTAHIIETWNAFLNDGTEGYRKFSNLGPSEVLNYIVFDDTEKIYDSMEKWNSDYTFYDKMYKSGIQYTDDGLELCWGISKYGHRTYTLKYEITNFITQYSDTQGINFKLLDLDENVGNVIIKIYSDMDFSLNNARIWAFGNNGTINFENEQIVISVKGLTKYQYITALIRFNDNYFQTNNIVSKSFDDEYNFVVNDGFAYKSKLSEYTGFFSNIYNKIFNVIISTSKENIVLGVLMTILLIVLIIILFFVEIIILPFYALPALILVLLIILILYYYQKFKYYSYGKINNTMYFGKWGKHLPSNKKIQYFRDIPCKKNISLAYWIGYEYDISKKDELYQGLLGALLLKMINNNSISIINNNLSQKIFSIKLNGIDKNADIIEKELYNMLQANSNLDKIVSIQDFANWWHINNDSISKWFTTIIESCETYLKENNLIANMTNQKNNLIFQVVDNNVKNYAIELKGLKKFLLEFSIIHEREALEVKNWDYYLIYAELLGIADKVEKQFKKLYSDYKFTNTDVNIDLCINFIETVKDRCYNYRNQASTNINGNDYSGRDRDSGSGGKSYSSGGKSSRGSSGGGFR